MLSSYRATARKHLHKKLGDDMKLSNIALIMKHFLHACWRWHHLHGTVLEQFQDERARLIVEYTRQHSPFYREYWVGHDPRQWRTLPIVDKELMMEHFDTFTTCGVRRDEAMKVALQAEQSRNFMPRLNGLTAGLSSGTSGHRGLFLVSEHEQAAWAGVILARALHSLRLSHLRIAFFLRSNSNLYEEVGGGPIQFRYFDLMHPLAGIVADLNDFQPHIVIGPPSLLGLLAEERIQDHLIIHPERLISVAEVLEPQDQEHLQGIFKVPVHQIYQCTEGLLAVSCAHGSLHIQEDLVALQFEPVSNGNDGRFTPIVTDLWRRTQPIIRYRLNDILQLDPAPCPCGSSFRCIRAIEGRCDDLCYFESQGGGIRPFFPDTIRRMILLADPHIVDYQVFQEHSGHLRVHLAVTPTVPISQVVPSVQSSVASIIAQYNCRPAILEIVEGLPAIVQGRKRRRVQRTNA